MTVTKKPRPTLAQRLQRIKHTLRFMLQLAKFYLFSKRMKRNHKKRAAIEQLIQEQDHLLHQPQKKPTEDSLNNSSEATTQSADLEHLVRDLFQVFSGSDTMPGQLDSLLTQGLDVTNACGEELTAQLDKLISDELGAYLSRSEFTPFSTALDELSTDLQSMQKQLNQLTRCDEIN